MSAYGIGADTASKQGEERVSKSQTNAPATIVKWIPGEAITFYAAILGIGATQGALTGDETAEELLERIDAGSFGWFCLGLAVAAAMVIVGSATAPRDANSTVVAWAIPLRIGLAFASFTLWASALPGAWPYGWNFIRDLGAAYGILLVPLGIVFASIAEWLTKKYRI